MRFAAIVVALAACRFHFDPAGDSGTPAAITYVQSTSDFLPAAGASSITEPLPGVTAHDAIVVVMFIMDQTVAVTGLTDSLGDVYTLSPPDDFDGLRYYFAYAADVQAGDDNLAVTMDGVLASQLEILVDEYAGVALASPLDTELTGTGTYTTDPSMTSAPLTTAGPGELVFGYGTGQCVANGSGFTERAMVHGDMTEDAVEAAAGTYETTGVMGCPTAGSTWRMLIAAFRPQIVTASERR